MKVGSCVEGMGSYFRLQFISICIKFLHYSYVIHFSRVSQLREDIRSFFRFCVLFLHTNSCNIILDSYCVYSAGGDEV